MTQPIAYMLADTRVGDLVFCPDCAFRATALGMILSGLPRPSSMDEAIAATALAQVERGLNIDTPVPVVSTEHTRCMNCHAALVEEAVA
jgi:hypothetical protein